MGKVGAGLFDDFKPHAIYKDKTVRFLNDCGQLASEACTINQPELNPVANFQAINLSHELGDHCIFGLSLALGFILWLFLSGWPFRDLHTGTCAERLCQLMFE